VRIGAALRNRKEKAGKFGRCSFVVGGSRSRRATAADAGPAQRPETSMTLDPSLPILIVDDYKTMLRIIRNLLKQIGFTNVDEASDGVEALGKLREKAYGLVISDWNMQPMTGLDLLREVRADADHEHLPFIMITAESKAEHVVAAKAAGVKAYIVKPFNAETLKAKMVGVVGKA
jgi:two-component system, chemotaxis family, chemotaxis protein CheY